MVSLFLLVLHVVCLGIIGKALVDGSYDLGYGFLGLMFVVNFVAAVVHVSFVLDMIG